MRTRLIFIAVAILAGSACTKEAANKDLAERQIVLTAWNEGAGSTRSTVIDGGAKVHWEPGDKSGVFYGGIGSCFTTTCTEPATVSDFYGTMTGIGGINEGEESGDFLWGLYPYRTDATSDGNSVTTTLPAIQQSREGSFAQNTFITLARSSSFGLAFYNVCGGIRFSLTQTGIRRVVLEGLNGEDLAGTVKLVWENGVPAVGEITDGARSVSLKAPEGESFKTGIWYYLVSLPATLPDGFKLTLYKDDSIASVQYGKAFSIKRGIFSSVAGLDSEAEFTSGGGGGNEDASITIDGDFWDWLDVSTGLTSTKDFPIYQVFKVTNDNKNIYFYSKRDNSKDNSKLIWGGEGYYYYDLDIDNDSSTGVSKEIAGLEFWMYIKPFAGSSASPAFATEVKGDAYPSKDALKSVLFAGYVHDDVVELEVSLPLSVAGIKKGDVIGIYSWGNKSGDDFKKTKLVYTVK